MNYPQEIISSTAYVMQNADNVKINYDKLDAFCKHITPKDHGDTHWLDDVPFDISKLNEKEKIHLKVVFAALSFSYWGDNEDYWVIDGQERGSWSLVGSILRAKEEGINILDSHVQKNLTKEKLATILRGNIVIPMLQERVTILNEIGTIISDQYYGDFRNMIETDALAMLEKIIGTFPSFADTAIFKGKTVSFYKRAQILVQSLHLENHEQLTALADYIIPRKLRDEGILSYSKELAQAIDSKTYIPAKSNYEVEMRSAVIQVVEYIKNKKKISAQSANDYLWLIGRNNVETEFHRTRTTAY